MLYLEIKNMKSSIVYQKKIYWPFKLSLGTFYGKDGDRNTKVTATVWDQDGKHCKPDLIGSVQLSFNEVTAAGLDVPAWKLTTSMLTGNKDDILTGSKDAEDAREKSGLLEIVQVLGAPPQR